MQGTRIQMIPDIIFFGGMDWERDSRRFMIKAMAKYIEPFGAKVLYVSRPVDLIVTPLKHRSRFFNRLRKKPILDQGGANLFLYTPFIPVHDVVALGVPPLKGTNRRFLASSLNQLMRHLGFHSEYRVSWMYHPYQLESLGLVGEDVTVYESLDNLFPEGTNAWLRTRVERLERRLLAKVDVVLATARSLVEEKKRYHGNVHWMPNAVDFGNFAAAADPETPEAEAVKGLSPPVIGLIGVFNERLDYDILAYMAGQRPDWTFVMIGPVWRRRLTGNSGFSQFERMPNAKFLGWVDHEDIGSYGKVFDVCIIPYRMNYAFNNSVNPLKLYEYTAMGKPVVTTNIPGIRHYEDIVYVAEDPQTFMTLVERCLAEDSHVKVKARLERARDDSWDGRVEKEVAILQSVLESKRKAGLLDKRVRC